MSAPARVFIDTVAFVALLKEHDEFKEAAQRLLRRVQEGRLKAVASAVSLMEVSYVVRRLGGSDEQVSHAVHACLSIENLEFLPITHEVIRQAVDHVLAYRLRLSDAIIAATMAQEDVEVLASEDADFDSVPFVRRIPLARA